MQILLWARRLFSSRLLGEGPTGTGAWHLQPHHQLYKLLLILSICEVGLVTVPGYPVNLVPGESGVGEGRAEHGQVPGVT